MGALGGRKEEREWGVFRNWSGRKGRVNRERAIRERNRNKMEKLEKESQKEERDWVVDHKGRPRAESERAEWVGKEELNGMWKKEEQQREFLEGG